MDTGGAEVEESHCYGKERKEGRKRRERERKKTKLTETDGSNKTCCCTEVWLRHGDLSIAVTVREPWNPARERERGWRGWNDCAVSTSNQCLRVTARTESDNTDRFFHAPLPPKIPYFDIYLSNYYSTIHQPFNDLIIIFDPEKKKTNHDYIDFSFTHPAFILNVC